MVVIQDGPPTIIPIQAIETWPTVNLAQMPWILEKLNMTPTTPPSALLLPTWLDFGD
jgi:hypothetical protein